MDLLDPILNRLELPDPKSTRGPEWTPIPKCKIDLGYVLCNDPIEHLQLQRVEEQEQSPKKKENEGIQT